MKNKKLNKYLLRIPIYIFTTLFVILPLAYMVIISFLTKAKTWGFDFTFTLENYKKVFDPFYLNIFLVWVLSPTLWGDIHDASFKEF